MAELRTESRRRANEGTEVFTAISQCVGLRMKCKPEDRLGRKRAGWCSARSTIA